MITPHKAATDAGLDSLPEMARISTIPLSTLKRWYYGEKHVAFKVMLRGCVAERPAKVASRPGQD